jgi:hypothetical protein
VRADDNVEVNAEHRRIVTKADDALEWNANCLGAEVTARQLVFAIVPRTTATIIPGESLVLPRLIKVSMVRIISVAAILLVRGSSAVNILVIPRAAFSAICWNRTAWRSPKRRFTFSVTEVYGRTQERSRCSL